jgi:hypothetical protein
MYLSKERDMLTLYLTDRDGCHSGREYWEDNLSSILRIMDRLERQGYTWIMDCVGADELEISYWRIAQAIVLSRRALQAGKRVVINEKVFGGEADARLLRAVLVEENNEGRLILPLCEETDESLTIVDGRHSLPYNRN